ncbi:hypothetical protein ACF0H5_024308 [Mactra antiquata]
MLSKDQPPSEPGPSGSSPSWCVCTMCPPMVRDEDKVCCGMAPQYCYSRRPIDKNISFEEMIEIIKDNDESNDINTDDEDDVIYIYEDDILITYIILHENTDDDINNDDRTIEETTKINNDVVLIQIYYKESYNMNVNFKNDRTIEETTKINNDVVLIQQYYKES